MNPPVLDRIGLSRWAAALMASSLLACNLVTGADHIALGGGGGGGTSSGTHAGNSGGTSTTTSPGGAGASGLGGGTATGAGGQGAASGCSSGVPCSSSIPSGGACTTALDNRAEVTMVSVGAPVQGDVWLAPEPGGCAKAAWISGTEVHLTPLTGDGQRFGPDGSMPGTEIRGLVAHDDGAALLIRRDDRMDLVGVCGNGANRFEIPIVGGNNHDQSGDKWIDSWPHEGRLAWSGAQYAAYFGHTQNWGAQGNHQGDILAYYDGDGAPDGLGWGWGCSHSLDVRIAHSGATFGPVCVSDCYPDKGIYFDHNTLVSSEPSGNCLGSSDARLGGLVAVSGGFMLTYSSSEGRSSFDIALVHISSTGTVGSPVWLTDTAGTDERTSYLARYGSNLLVGWLSEGNLTLSVVNDTGTVVEGPALASVGFGGADFINLANGDVAWAFGQGSEVAMVRLPHCQ
ncbi:MAG: hypothetical protein JRI23_01225 [Deltaproteobacteria bacterium]|jgi:hypothetical protein|nr:hypothetical protein [Deltaproteobacteria bacterium]MBW2530076.1 hypothetical protein [Deltaproteobacteria bacterium]